MTSDEVEDDSLNPQERVLQGVEYMRYGRQMILPEIGLRGQLRIHDASVLIVGLGGLGCPAAAYLAGAGVGTLGLMDGDVVDMSNLHRQILHTTDRIGMLKVKSAGIALQQINPHVQYKLHPEHLVSMTAVQHFRKYDLILDCTDHPTSRYLISDAAVCSGRPFVSAAALRTDGQLYVLNYPPFREDCNETYVSGPCYRCIHPKPPPPESLISCGEGGILGPVVGTMGVLMATEAIKIIASGKLVRDNSYTADKMAVGKNCSTAQATPNHSMLLYSAFGSPPFRSVKVRGRRQNCPACSPEATLRSINTEVLSSGAISYTAFCGQIPPSNTLPPDARIGPQELVGLWDELGKDGVLLLDTRDEIQFEICSIPGSINMPMERVKDQSSAIAKELQRKGARSIVTVCRFGNDSQFAAMTLQQELSPAFKGIWIGDLKGGLEAWRREVDPEFPQY